MPFNGISGQQCVNERCQNQSGLFCKMVWEAKFSIAIGLWLTLTQQPDGGAFQLSQNVKVDYTTTLSYSLQFTHSIDHNVYRSCSLDAGVYILTTKVFFIPPTPPEKIFSFPVIFQREDTKLWTHQCRFYKYYSRKCSKLGGIS